MRRLATSALAILVAAAALGAAVGDEVVVVVNGQAVPRANIEKILAPLRKANLPPAELAEHERRAVGELIVNVLIDQFLRRAGYDPSPEEVEAEIGRKRRIYRESRPSGGRSFEEALRARGLSVEELRKRLPARMSFSCYVRGLMTENDILRLFETKRPAFDGTEVRARHILVDTRSLRIPAEKEAARAKAEAIRTRILQGEDFAEVAKKESDCPSRERGGDLDFFPRRGRMVEPFAAAAFATEKGGVSPVVETPFGYHVIQVTDVRPGRPVTLDEVRRQVEDAWAEERGQEIYGKIVASAKVEWPTRRR